ncbi:MAG: hypothetical protein AAFU57_05530 [Bacteroidota bacterium]
MSSFLEIIKARRTRLISAPVVTLLVCFLLGWRNNGEIASSSDKIPSIEVVKSDLELRPTEGEWFYNGKPFNGFAVQFHSNGNLKEKVAYAQGKKQGKAYKWYADGTLASEKNYAANRLEGKSVMWWPNGSKSDVSFYKNRKRHGVQTKWYPDGTKARIMRFQDGKEHGLQQAWLPIGKIYVNYEAKNGRFFGLKRSNLCYQLKDEVVQP